VLWVATVAANKTHEGDIMKLQKALAVMGAGVLLFAASDAITYAATGSSLVLGKINAANATTTIQNTGTAPALRLLTKSTATAPMVVNGKGKVTNLYADRAATADNAVKLSGKTPAQILAGAPRPAGVIWVAKSGGQFTSIKAALASITNNGPAHPYVIKVAPGTYVETGSIVVKNYVDIEGSGRDRTTLLCGCSGNSFQAESTVIEVTAVNAEIRDLTIANKHNVANSGAIAVSVLAPTPTFSLVHVKLTALDSGTGGLAEGLHVYNSATAGPHLDDLYVYVVGSPGGNSGMFLAAPTIVRNSWIQATGTSVYASGGSSLIASTIAGNTAGLSARCTAVFGPTGNPVTCN
jgi:hypothetical protein